MEAYFDNSATTKALDSVRDIMVKTLTEDFGNPSAKHTKGMEAELHPSGCSRYCKDLKGKR